MRRAAKRIILLLWLAIAAFQLLFIVPAPSAKGTADNATVSAGHDLVINSANGGINQASTIVAGNTVTLLGTWENQSEGTYYGKNWLLVYEAADSDGTQSLDGNDRYRPVGVPGGDRSAETDVEVIGDGWNFGSGVWQFVESPYFAWNSQSSGPTQSPWIFKDAIFPGTIDGRDAHDFFGVTDSLKLQFVITSNPPTHDVNHLNLKDQPGRQGVIDGLAGGKEIGSRLNMQHVLEMLS
jgi:hypothetical protein